MSRSFFSLVLTLVFCFKFAFGDQPFYKDLEALNHGVFGQYPNQTFRSTNIIAPRFQVNTFEPDLVSNSGYIFLTVSYNGGSGPAIFSSKDLSLVYADINYQRSFDARAQVLKNNKYLTFFEGGYCHGFDDSYQKRWTVTAQDLGKATKADMHEFQFTDSGTAIMSIYQDIKYDLTAIKGPDNGMLSDGVFQELNLETNNVLFVWRASSHFNLTDSYIAYDPKENFMGGEGFDWFHINSVYKNKDGNYLVSSKALSMIALIDPESGHPIWILGGKKNQFRDLSGGNATNFRNQYNARYVNGNTSQISLFDNHVFQSGQCGQGGQANCSRGMVVELDYTAKTVRLLKEFFYPQHVSSESEGSVQALENGNFLVAWGVNPAFTEHLPNGSVAMDVQRGALLNVADVKPDRDMTVYRAWKMDWVGRPQWGPSIAAVSNGNSTNNATIYVSWNGNTEVERWEVYAGSDKNKITIDNKVVGNSTRNGFETAIVLDGEGIPRYAKAVALTKDNHVQGLTMTVDVMTGQLYGESSSIWNVTDNGDRSGSDDLKDWEGNKNGGDASSSGSLSMPLGLFLSSIMLAITWNEL